MPVEQARRAKWEAGKAVYGDEFVGEPAEHGDEECLDAWNYAEQMEKEGYPPYTCRAIKETVENLQQLFRSAYTERHKTD